MYACMGTPWPVRPHPSGGSFPGQQQRYVYPGTMRISDPSVPLIVLITPSHDRHGAEVCVSYRGTYMYFLRVMMLHVLSPHTHMKMIVSSVQVKHVFLCCILE